MATKKIEMTFSDESYGTEEYGYLPRRKDRDADKENVAYQRYLLNVGIRAAVCDGYVWLTG